MSAFPNLDKMGKKKMHNKSVLIADDIEMNRAILAMTFEEEYDILEAENGLQVLEQLKQQNNQIQAILLDLVMPKMDGFTVLKQLAEQDLLEKIPVFLITAENEEKTLSKAYELGVVDVINKPFIPALIRKRIHNVLELFNARKQLSRVIQTQEEALKAQEQQLLTQAQKFQKLNSSIIDTLSTVIEFRDCESGEHVKRIRSLTMSILDKVRERYPEYGILEEEIPLIGEAAVMHDVGKIAIPDAILNKPGKLTSEEFEIMKLHTVRGCEILRHVPQIIESGLYQYCYDICRHHHERWDGKGYPDKLKGDEIPIWAQVVSLADVYDALISARVYKKAFSREKSCSMICSGECGAFNPKLIDCFLQAEEEIYCQWYQNQTPEQPLGFSMQWNQEESKETLLAIQLDWEKQCKQWMLKQNNDSLLFFCNIKQDYIEYSPAYAELFGESLNKFHARDFINNDENIIKHKKDIYELINKMSADSPEHNYEITLKTKNEGEKDFVVQICSIWYENKNLIGYIGKLNSK